MMGKQAHVVVVPYPAQGHVIPLLKLSHKIAEYGIKVTVVNTEFIHAKIMAAMPDHKDEELQNRVRLVSIPDGLGPRDDQRDGVEVMESIRRVMPGHLKDFIEKIGQSEEKMIRCVIADATLGWILEVAKEMGIEQAVVWPAGPGGLLLHPHLPKLIELGVLDMNVTVLRNELIILSKDVRLEQHRV
ncbi:UDP-glycosyltransferase 83A1-like [Camellia sinensis]|uniref:UDP-glycosyltransferase 83A1-like n=1 Tax=Camellia sinensis TaxID=4442 RepID=UPI001035FBBA|nr:UDP-glycosyltransferase 83A1-like [Camellia sinensis]